MIKLFNSGRSFQSFRHNIVSYNENRDDIPEAFLLNESADGKLREYYIPFDYVNTGAKIIIVGLTPGKTQWENAVLAAKKAILEDADEETILMNAKQTGAFSGTLRDTLVEMLDYIGLNQKLHIRSVADCFEEGATDIHFTSAFINPIFKVKDGKLTNYSVSTAPSLGSPKNELLKESLIEGIVKEIQTIPQALIFTLGAPCAGIFDQLIEMGLVDRKRVFNGLPHPSRANSERIAYFLNKKDPEKASIKTNPYEIFGKRDQLMEKIKNI